jgi:hypothetical protein
VSGSGHPKTDELAGNRDLVSAMEDARAMSKHLTRRGTAFVYRATDEDGTDLGFFAVPADEIQETLKAGDGRVFKLKFAARFDYGVQTNADGSRWG